MIVEFIGADHEVTGSCHYVECGETKILIDYGLEQGINYFKNVDLPVSPAEIDYIIVTHAHIDHIGRIPILLKQGFNGTIICTEATADLIEIMLMDSADLAEQNANNKNKRLAPGKKPVVPVFDINDVHNTLESIYSIKYEVIHELSDNVSIRFIDAGHLLGSASVEMFLNENGVQRKIVFSGDIGNIDKPIIRDPQYVSEADYVVTEATYGDSVQANVLNHIQDLQEIIQSTFDAGGNVIIPAFAVGRTQEMLYYLTLIKLADEIKNHDNFEVWIDSPMAVKATEVFRKNLLECYDDETKELIDKGVNPIVFNDLRLAVTKDESKELNYKDYPKVIISSSGMCDAGRIRYHLRRNLFRPESTVVFAGYQAVGTLGRKLLDGADRVMIDGEEVLVNAKLVNLMGMSSHADQEGLLRWIRAFDKNKLSRVFVVHADDKVAEQYCEMLNFQEGIKTDAPYSGSIFDLGAGEWIYRAKAAPLRHTKEQIDSVDIYVREVR